LNFSQFTGNRIFTISPLIAEFNRRDRIFEIQAKKLNFYYTTHTGPLESKYFEFTKHDLMKRDINSDDKNTWVSRSRAALVTQSHLDVIKFAKDLEFDNVCIFENDVLFHKDFNQIFDIATEALDDTEWDILYLGAIYNYQDSFWITNKFENETLFKAVKGAMCSHGYILNKSAITKIIEDFDKCVENGKYFIIDQFLSYATEHLNYKTFGILPKLVEQGYCGTPSLTQGLDLEVPYYFDFRDVYVREELFEQNKSSNATKADYEKIIHDSVNNISKNIQDNTIKTVEDLKKIEKLLYVDEDIYEKRMSICKTCDKLTEDARCEMCGCRMLQKNKIKTFSCPLKKF
jgi:GR25 family glycosyltransferase involved in LPS biosynthesis